VHWNGNFYHILVYLIDKDYALVLTTKLVVVSFL